MRVVLLVALVILAAGCGGSDRGHVLHAEAARPRAETVPMPAFASGTHVGWRGVLNDWFSDGKLDGRHSCRAVREAMRHVPVDGPTTNSTILSDLHAYARRVCRPRRADQAGRASGST